MKKIAIFGDSWGAEDPPYGWSHLLKLGDPDNIDLFGAEGSSLGWSLEQFLNNHHNYEKIVFVITLPYRIYFPVTCISKFDGHIRIIEHWSSLAQIERQMKKYTSENNMLDKLLDLYINYICAPSREVQELNSFKAMLSYLTHIRSDTIFIPTVTRYYPTVDPVYHWSLGDIFDQENNYNLDLVDSWHYGDTRCNHLSVASNLWVLEHVKARLEGNFIEWSTDQTPTFKTRDEFMKGCGLLR